MYLNLCPGPIGIGPMPFDQLVALAVRHGFGGVDLPNDVLESPAAADAARAALAAAGLRAGLFWMPMDVTCCDDAAFDAGLRRLRTIAPSVARAGGTRTYSHVFPGSNELPYAANFARHVERYKQVVDVLAPHGVTLGLEFIGPKTFRDSFRHPFAHTLAGVLEIADAVGRGGAVCVALDCYHWWTSGGTLDELRRLLPGRPVVNVHLNDGVAGRERDAQLDLERAMPLTSGLVDVAGVARVLAEVGYDGPAIVEPFDPTRSRLSKLPPDAAAAEAAAAWRRVRDAAGL